MNAAAPRRRRRTVYEALDDAGLRTAAINFTCYRGRTRAPRDAARRHAPACGPKRFFFYNLFESDATGAPLSVRATAPPARSTTTPPPSAAGSSPATASTSSSSTSRTTTTPRTRSGRTAPHAKLAARTARSPASWTPRAGRTSSSSATPCSSAPTTARRPCTRPSGWRTRLQDSSSSARSGSSAPTSPSPRRTARARSTGSALRRAARAAGRAARRRARRGRALFLEDGDAVARRGGEELRFGPDGPLTGDRPCSTSAPDAFTRAWAALHNPNAGDVLVSASDGFEFADLGGGTTSAAAATARSSAGDSEVPMLAVGIDAPPASITGIAPAVLERLGAPLSRAA